MENQLISSILKMSINVRRAQTNVQAQILIVEKKFGAKSTKN